MVSTAKSDAARRNGRLSKGPTTLAGKEVSRRNALRDGFMAQKLFMANESEEEFKRFLAGMVEALQPADTDEDELVNGISMCRWRLRRIFRAEACMLDGGYEDDAYIVKTAPLRCLGDREAKILRTMTVLEKRLEERQALRSKRADTEAEEPKSEHFPSTTAVFSTSASVDGRMTAGGARDLERKPHANGKTNPPIGGDAVARTSLDPPGENGKTNPPPQAASKSRGSVTDTATRIVSAIETGPAPSSVEPVSRATTLAEPEKPQARVAETQGGSAAPTAPIVATAAPRAARYAISIPGH